MNGGITEGRRNDKLFKLTCRLRDAVLVPETIERVVQEVNAVRCKPPLADSEVKVLVRSAAAVRK